MTDAEARQYGIAALEGLADELEGAIVHSRELDAHDYIDRMRAAASRLDLEHEGEDRLLVLEEAVVELAQRVEFVSGKVLGGVPSGPVLLDGPELEREDRAEFTRQNVERARRGETLLSRTFRQ